jgi:hypothetical protein
MSNYWMKKARKNNYNKGIRKAQEEKRLKYNLPLMQWQMANIIAEKLRNYEESHKKNMPEM